MFSETTTTEYAADLADDMAAHGVELLQDAELLLADLQAMPLPPPSPPRLPSTVLR